MKNQPVQVDPNKDITPEQKSQDLKNLVQAKEVKKSVTTGKPQEQESSNTQEINPFRND